MKSLLNQVTSRAKNSHWANSFLRRNPLHYRRLERTFAQWHDSTLDEPRISGEVQAFVEARLQHILGVASMTPYGKAVGGRDTIESWPILEKTHVRSAEQAMVSSTAKIKIPASTSGSTGVPLQLYRSPMSIVVEQVCIDKILTSAGVHATSAKIAVLRGDTVKDITQTKPPFWRRTETGHKLVMSSSHLSQATIHDYVSALQRYRCDGLMAYPGSLELFCRLLQATNGALTIPFVMSSSERLSPGLRTFAESTLQANVIDFYGQAERVAAAVSFRPNEYRFLSGYAYVELIPKAHQGEQLHACNYDVYEIVGTSLWNTAMPLIRYRTGDFIRVPRGTSEAIKRLICDGLHPFQGIHGRDMEYILTVDGTRVTNLHLIPDGVPHLLRVQIIQEKIDQLLILIVPDDAFSNEDEAQLRRNASNILPTSMHIRIECVNQTERTQSGKSPFIIRRNPDW